MPNIDKLALEETQYKSPRWCADVTDTSVEFIRDRIADGTLPAYRIGRMVRVKVSDLQALLIPVGGEQE